MKPEHFRQTFLKQLRDLQPFQALLDLLPDVAFFMKDRSGRFVMQNRRACNYCRVASEFETIGKTDYDFFPQDRAALYVEGDRKVMKSGVAIINAIAPAPEAEGSDRLIIYSKVPLYDRRGQVIGIAGIHREVEGMRATPKSYGRLARVVQHIHKNYSQRLSVRSLAAMAGVSTSQFERRFRRLFGVRPSLYVLRTRVHAACRLLANTTQSITDVAFETGFYDHSHFSRTFSRIMGVPPATYRRGLQ